MLTGIDNKIIGLALPALVLLWSISLPTRMLPRTTNNTEMSGSQLKNQLAQVVMPRTSDMYLLKLPDKIELAKSAKVGPMK